MEVVTVWARKHSIMLEMLWDESIIQTQWKYASIIFYILCLCSAPVSPSKIFFMRTS